MVGDGWQWLAVGGWRLAAGGGWRLVVGGPRGRSLRAVLRKKKLGSLKDRPVPNQPQNRPTPGCYRHDWKNGLWVSASPILGSSSIIIHHPNPNQRDNFRFSGQNQLSHQNKHQNRSTLHCYRHNRMSRFWDSAYHILGSAIILILIQSPIRFAIVDSHAKLHFHTKETSN